MSYSKSFTALLLMIASTAAVSADAGQRSRGRAPSGGSAVVGRAAPRTYGGGRVAPRIISPRVGVRAPLRSYYYPYYYGYRPGLSIGLGFYGGYPYYGYYGYPYGAYGYSYGGYYAPGYGYGYGLPPAGYVSAVPGAAYGGIRIQGAPRNAQVYVDGYYAGIVNDFDGTFQRLDLEAGSHEVEIRIAGAPPLTYDVNVTPGQTLVIHANVR